MLLLSRAYTCRYGVPIVDRVDQQIFQLRYYFDCMSCNFCHDVCCQYGVDVDVQNLERIETHADALEQFLGVPREQWFTGEFNDDPEVPGGRHTRTRVIDGRCVFVNRTGRGCRIHAYCLENNLDVHDIKPMISVLFPITFEGGLLRASNEVVDGTLVCSGQGPTAYRGAREDLRYYFGDGLVDELDGLECQVAISDATIDLRENH